MKWNSSTRAHPLGLVGQDHVEFLVDAVAQVDVLLLEDRGTGTDAFDSVDNRNERFGHLELGVGVGLERQVDRGQRDTVESSGLEFTDQGVQVVLNVDPVFFDAQGQGVLVLGRATHDTDDGIGVNERIKVCQALGVTGRDEEGVGHHVVGVGEHGVLTTVRGDEHAGDHHVVVRAELVDECAPVGEHEFNWSSRLQDCAESGSER